MDDTYGDDFDFLPDGIDGENPPLNNGNPVRFYKKHQKAAELVLNHGVDEKTALMLAVGKVPDSATLCRFREKVSKYSLARPALQKLASKAVQDTLQGKVVEIEAVKILANGDKVPYTEKIVPSYTNKLAAAAMVTDRTEPIVRQNMNLNVNVDIAPVDLSRYRNR